MGKIDRLVLVCSPVSNFLNDVTATCATCGETVYHRPHAPAAVAQLVCVACYYRQFFGVDHDVAITHDTWLELTALRAHVRGTH